jgi:hypothetical protein
MTDSVIVTKVHDKDCDICLHMSKHDRATFESFPEVNYQEVYLEEVLDNTNSAKPLTLQRIYQCLERYCLNSDYSIDLPVYLFLTKQGKYLGHLQGALSIPELRDGVKSNLDLQNSE